MIDIFYNEVTYWLLGTALIFTFVGRHFQARKDMEDVVEATIDSLILQGYIKTKGVGDKMELLKHWDKEDG
jgi:hypothetical protein|tara:strand:- start:5174 stop:5386 length:213 start_codon:yes stop_codon:yes gene_type:complete